MHFILDKSKELEDLAAHFSDEKASISNPREEAAEAFTSMASTLLSSWGKDLTELTKLSASAYTNMLQIRRFVC